MRYAVISRPPGQSWAVRLLITDVPPGIGKEAVSAGLNAARIVHGLPDAAIAAVTRKAGDPYFEVTAETERGNWMIPPGTPEVQWDRFIAGAWGWPAVAVQAAQRQVNSQGAWRGHVGARPACDPTLSPRDRARLRRAWTMLYWPFLASPARMDLRRRDLLVTRAAGAAASVLLFGLSGGTFMSFGNAVTWPAWFVVTLAVIVICCSAGGIVACGPAAEYLYSRYIGWRYRGRHVHLAMLPGEYQPLLLRAQFARDVISDLPADAAVAGGDPAAEAAWQEWAIARRLRQIAEHRQSYGAGASDRDGGDAVGTSVASVARRVRALENLATRLSGEAFAASGPAPARIDEREDDANLDLLAGTAADDHAVADINRLAGRDMDGPGPGRG